MSEYAYSFDDLRGDILGVMQSMGAAHAAQQKLDEAMAADLARLWADNAELRDELHALANRVETLTRARLTEPAEVAERMVFVCRVNAGCNLSRPHVHHDDGAVIYVTDAEDAQRYYEQRAAL
jgi:hypothetical protein